MRFFCFFFFSQGRDSAARFLSLLNPRWRAFPKSNRRCALSLSLSLSLGACGSHSRLLECACSLSRSHSLSRSLTLSLRSRLSTLRSSALLSPSLCSCVFVRTVRAQKVADKGKSGAIKRELCQRERERRKLFLLFERGREKREESRRGGKKKARLCLNAALFGFFGGHTRKENHPKERSAFSNSFFMCTFYVCVQQKQSLSLSSRDAPHGANLLKPHHRSRAHRFIASTIAIVIRVITDGHLHFHRREIRLV